MRVKQLGSYLNVPAKAGLVWNRITFSRLTTCYFALACIHCIIQVIFQARALSANAAAASSLWSKMVAANRTAENAGFAVLGDDLRVCYTVPKAISVKSCKVIWNSTYSAGTPYGLAAASLGTSPSPVATTTINGTVTLLSASPTSPPASPVRPTVSSQSSSVSSVTSSASVLASSKSTANAGTASLTIATLKLIPTPNVNAQTAKTVVITQGGEESNDGEVHGKSDTGSSDKHNSRRSLTSKHADTEDLGGPCTDALIWPVQKLNNTKREDIIFIGFQLWVLGVSIVALLNESIPHIIAAFLTHMLATIWAINQIFETEQFRGDFKNVITNGACRNHNLLGNYWEMRKTAEISGAVLNGVVLLASFILTQKLVKIYGWQTFKRVGASLTINRIYRLVLSLSIAIQLTLFFIIAAMAIWIDQLYTGNIGRLATAGKVYKIVDIIVFCLLIPWLSMGWFAVRRENRRMALVFLILSLLFIGLWGAMFYSTTFRWTFVTWEFFAVIASTAGILMISTFILGLACRINFGKGLPRYLHAEESFDGGDFTPVYPGGLSPSADDPEKIDFPSFGGRPIPTFSETFEHGPEVPKPTQMRFGPGHAPGASMHDGTVQEQSGRLGHAMGRSGSLALSHSGSEGSLTRNDTSASHQSTSSTSSSPSDNMGRRWVIE